MKHNLLSISLALALTFANHVSASQLGLTSDQHTLYLPIIQTTPVLLLNVYTSRPRYFDFATVQGTAKNISQNLVFNPTILLEFENGLRVPYLITITTLLSYTFPGQTNFVAKFTELNYDQFHLISAKVISTPVVTNPDVVALTAVASTPSFTTTLITLTNLSVVTITEISLAYWPALFQYPIPELLHLPIPPGGSISLLRDFYVGNPPSPDYPIPPTKVMAYGRP